MTKPIPKPSPKKPASKPASKPKILDTDLSIEESQFAVLIAHGNTQSAAYRIAFPQTSVRKWSNAALSNKACCLAKKPAVMARIQELKKERANRTEGEINRLVNELSEMAFRKLSEEMTCRDKLKALELLGKILGVFEKDNHQKSEPVANALLEIIQSAQTHGVQRNET